MQNSLASNLATYIHLLKFWGGLKRACESMQCNLRETLPISDENIVRTRVEGGYELHAFALKMTGKHSECVFNSKSRHIAGQVWPEAIIRDCCLIHYVEDSVLQHSQLVANCDACLFMADAFKVVTFQDSLERARYSVSRCNKHVLQLGKLHVSALGAQQASHLFGDH